MTILVNTFEGGTQGTTISTGNSGGTSGNAFDNVSIGSGGTLTYDGTQAAHGSLSAEITTAGSGVFFGWVASLGTQTQVWFRQYLYLTGNPSANIAPFKAQSGASNCAQMGINTSGKITFQNAAFSTVITSASTIPLNQWFRVEGFVLAGTSTGQLSFSLYDAADSVTPTETQTSTAAQVLLASMDRVNFGQIQAVSAGPFWMDDIGVSTTGYLGPFGYLYEGQQACDYLDYLDMATGQTLAPVPGNSYLMTPVNSRAGLTVPPPQRPWFPPSSAGGGGSFAPLLRRVQAPEEQSAAREQALAAHGHYFSDPCPHCDPAPRQTPPALPDTAEGALAAHGHYAGSVCRHCDPAPAEPPPLVRRVDGPDFAPVPSLAEIRTALALSPIAHGHYTPCRCEHCVTAGQED